MAGDAGDGGGDGETQALEGGTKPPLGELMFLVCVVLIEFLVV